MPNPVIRIMGIDPAWSKPFGYAIVAIGTCPDKPALLDYGSVYAKELAIVIDRAGVVIDGAKVDLIAIEDQFLKINYNTAKCLSYASGMVMEMARRNDIETRTVNVASWKARFLGKYDRQIGKKGGYPLKPIDACKRIFFKDLDIEDDEACAALIAYYQCLVERGK